MKAKEAWEGTRREPPTEAEKEAIETLLGLLWERIRGDRAAGAFSVSLSQFWKRHIQTEYDFEVSWPTVSVAVKRRDALFLYFVERVAAEGYRIEYASVVTLVDAGNGCSASWFLGGEDR